VRAGAGRGGTAILVAFLLLALMAGAALATGRNVLRELAAAADAAPEAGAEAAADSGLAWFLAWAEAEPEGVRAFLARLEGEPPGTPGSPPGQPGRGWAAAEDPLDQRFRLSVRRLGAWPGPEGAGTGHQAWRVTATGTCRSRGPGPAPTFSRVQELLCTAPPAGAWVGPAAGAVPVEPPPPWRLRVLVQGEVP